MVFVGPYEHHSNEIMWRQSLATTVEVRLDASGNVDLAHLEELLQDPTYEGRVRIGSFLGSLQRYGYPHKCKRDRLHAAQVRCYGLFRLCGVRTLCRYRHEPRAGKGKGDDPSLDAIFISPHKFLGGPGSSGVLVFNQRIYHRDLPPSVSAGGTVDYVGMTDQDFIGRIEEREKAGTPGVLQTLKAAAVFQIKDRVGVDTITSASTSTQSARWTPGAATTASRYSETRTRNSASE